MRFLLFLLVFPLAAQSDSDPLAPARSALEAGFPQVAVQKITEAFPKIRSGRQSPPATILLARALCEAGRPDEAEKLLKLPGSQASPERSFWLAQATAAQDRWEAALPLYADIIDAPDPDLSHRATIGAARAESHLGSFARAVEILSAAKDWPESTERSTALLDLADANLSLGEVGSAKVSLDALSELDPGLRARRDFLLARWMIATGDDFGAAKLFAHFKPTNDGMAVAAVIDQSLALSRLGQSPDAENLLEDFIEAHPEISGIDTVFSALDGFYQRSPVASTAELKRWSEDRESSERKAHALFYRALSERRQGHSDAALQLLKKFLTTTPNGPLAKRAIIEIASLELESGRPDAALAVLPKAKIDLDAGFLRGLALSVKRNPAEAAISFRLAANEPRLAEAALFNAAVSEILAGKSTKTSWNELKARFPGSSRLARLDLIEAFDLARSGSPEAEERLAALSAASGSPVAGDAGLALAEWKFLNGRPDQARLALQQVSTEADPARRAALSVFLADAEGSASPDTAIDSALKYLEDFPGSEAEPEVRMKLGELLYKKGDFGGARMQFDALARKFSGTRFEEPALFLAGQSASRLLDAASTNDAMLLFEEVASMNKSFALRARFEQAVLQNSLNRPSESLVILDRILASQPDAATRATTLMEKGKTQFLAPSADQSSLKSAIATWQSIASDPEVGPLWKNQALARIGIAQEKLGDTDAALASFYGVIKPTDGPRPEFFWFYKAGFDAGRLLESAKRWEEAVRVYEILASSDGPRTPEARERINKIRLENFLWEGN